MRKKRIGFLISVLVIALLLISGETTLTYDAEGEVDWERGVIVVEGFGVPPEDVTRGQGRLLAQRAAKADAYRNAVEFIEGVQVDSETIVQDYAVESDDIKTRVEGLVRGGEFISIEYGPDDICEVRLEVPLTAQNGSDGLDSFLERPARDRREEDSIDDIEQYLERDDREVDDRIDEEIDDRERISEYTGVIIDARGLNVEPALYPQIFDSEGYSLYGPNSVGPDNPSGVSSLVAYARDESRAKEIDRLGGNPIVIDAVSVIERDGVKPTDVIVGSEAAEIINELKASNQLLEQRAVAILID